MTKLTNHMDRAVHRLLPATSSAVAFFIVALSPVSYSGGDTYGALLVSQALVQRGTVQLDEFADYFQEPGGGLRHSVGEIRGHLYFRYPLGVSILSVPIVAAVNLVGMDVRDSERLLQKFLSAIVAACLVLLLFTIARMYLDQRTSALISLLGFFGTIIAPTVGGALWSINYALVFLGLAMFLLLRAADEPLSRSAAMWLGVVLFFGYASRPTFALFVLCVFVYLWFSDRAALPLSAGISGLLFLAYSAWYFSQYGTILPPIYVDGRLGLLQVGSSIPGLLFSPSRSLLIWNPFLIALPIVAWQAWRLRTFTRLMGMLVASSALMLLVQILYPNWWGGWSYGPRIATEMIFLLLVFSIVAYGNLRSAPAIRLFLQSAAIVAFLAGIAVNLQGLYNPYTLHWNAYPDVDRHAQVLFDWRFPQFGIDREALIRKYEVQSSELGLTADDFVPHQEAVTVLLASTPRSVTTVFRVGGEHQEFYARVAGVSFRFGTLAAYLNGSLVGEYSVGSAFTHLVDLPGDLIKFRSENQLRLEMHPKAGRLNAFFGAFSIRQY